MNAIAGRASYGIPTGVVLINGVPDTVHNYSTFVGFVPQGLGCARP